MEYCCNCKSRECSYIEIKSFIEYITDKANKDFKIIECPDKSNAKYTCDMVLKDSNSEEKIYVEIKEVKYGFAKNKDKSIAEDNGQSNYSFLISNVIERLGKDKIEILNNFIITIPKAQISKNEQLEFGSKLFEFIDETAFDCDYYEFLFKRKNENIKISFERKKDEVANKFGKKLLFEYETEKDNLFNSILTKLTDIEELDGLLMKNANNTSEKKFIGVYDRRILLNILKLPIGYEMFFNFNMNYIIAEIVSRAKNYKSAANECYLLYYCEDYYDQIYENDTEKIKHIGEVLFIFPLISGLITEPIGYILASDD